MAVTRKHSPFAIYFGAVLIGGVQRQKTDTGLDVRREATSGEVYPRFVAIYGRSPTADFSTKNIAAALTQAGGLGKKIDDLSGGLSVFGQKHAAGGTRAGAASHRKVNYGSGLVYPVSMSVSGKDDVTIDYQATVVMDGSGNLEVITDSVSLPSGIVDNERFALGPVTLGGVLLPQLRGWDVNFGLKVVAESDGSEVAPSFVSIEEVLASITLRGMDQQWQDNFAGSLGTIGAFGQACTHANSSIYLRKRLSKSTFVADNVAEHIKLSVDGMVTIGTALDGSGTGATEIVANVAPVYDGTNSPIKVTLNTAIT